MRLLESSMTAMFLGLSVACGGGSASTAVQDPGESQSAADDRAVAIVDHTVDSLTGEEIDLSSFRGRPMLIVNTASECGYTPQYAGLQKLHENYGDRGLVVIGFPSNDFGNQEPGSAVEIASFCRRNYGVSFPMMAKVHTKGEKQAPIYRTLTRETAEGIRGEIRWNFTKFLVDPEGRVVERFEPGVEPLDERITSAIEPMLAMDGPKG